MKSTASEFKKNVRMALLDPDLRKAMGFIKGGFVENRRAAVERLPEFEEMKRLARGIKEHTLQNLDFYLEAFEKRVCAQGGQVHWASTPKEACDVVIDICRRVGAKRVTKSKSMVGEEMAINEALEGAGFEPVETDPDLPTDRKRLEQRLEFLPSVLALQPRPEAHTELIDAKLRNIHGHH